MKILHTLSNISSSEGLVPGQSTTRSLTIVNGMTLQLLGLLAMSSPLSALQKMWISILQHWKLQKLPREQQTHPQS